MPQLTSLDVEFVSLVDRAAVRDPSNPSQPQRFLLFKRDGGETTTGGEMPNDETAVALQKAQDERDELRKQLEEQTELKAELAKAQKELDELKKAAEPKPEPTQIDKSELPAAVREALEKAEEAERVAKAEREELRKQAERAEEIAKAERDTRVTREFVAKAQELRSLSIDAEKFGPILKSAAEKLSKDAVEELDRVLKAADERVRSNDQILKELGRSGDGAPTAGGADEITRKAEEIRKADPSLTPWQAHQRALEDRGAQARVLDSVR